MVSPHHQKTFERAGVDPARMFIVPWYVDCELFSPAEHEDDGSFRVLFLGQITQRKGLSYLIDGFRRAALEDAELVLLGRPIGPTSPWMDTPGVRHVPPMPRFLLPEVLRKCHVIALPSIVEGFPIAVLEGMASGLPAVISENIGADFVEDGVDGFVVPTRDPEAIADRLRTLHADSARRHEMARAARSKAETFTLERYRQSLCGGVARMLGAPADQAGVQGRVALGS
jgi:glycosyltransferase involved in cell wall biosynthesis